MKKTFILIVLAFVLSACAGSNYGVKYPLHNAVYQNDMKKIQELAIAGIANNTRDSYGMLPIHIAASKETTEVAALLLSEGADVNSHDAYGNTPILIAAEYCSVDMMKLFIDNKAQTDLCNDSGNTILHYVSGCVYPSAEKPKILALLPSLVINVNALNKSGQSAYGIAMDNMNIELVAVLRARGVTERVGTTSSDNFNEALKKPSYFTPPSGFYNVPKEKELAYQLAVEDCNSYTIPNKKGLVMVTGPIGLAIGVGVDKVKEHKKFNACMKIMGFESANIVQ